ncbi:glycosyltransferase [Leucobacter chromiireducens]|uniref:Glycosyltransferase n=1 Tax=Leucobacter chromiireducens subsp. chromiireducens TaxID=660067 RepID=A0ABS1SPY3_9MICO|nr:glycosyltransferase [Leucobacter chromiireducens]MBL3690143.1 glycosyltransferase [Leucobacter chromiireducens subsp. chromiireducens]
MRVLLASRIFQPEAAAASFRLAALAEGFARAGHSVTVLTTTPVSSLAGEARAQDAACGYTVRRAPVLRDGDGYVRGYVQYMSFDIPLFFRILFGKRHDLMVVEPPPTTWLFAHAAAALRGIRVVPYAADVWSDASESTGAPGFVVRFVRWMERRVMNRGAGVLAVNDGVEARVREIAPRANIATVGNGIDTDVFTTHGPVAESSNYAIYSGTASEWQGAEVFVRAAAQLQQEGHAVEVVFLGQGSALPELRALADELDAPVRFVDSVPPAEAAAWIRGARMSLASIKPGAGYDFAYPTKIFAAWACGTPVLYAGPGPAREQLAAEPLLGIGSEHDAPQVAAAMVALLARDTTAMRETIGAWAQQHVSLQGVAARAVAFSEEVATRGTTTR